MPPPIPSRSIHLAVDATLVHGTGEASCRNASNLTPTMASRAWQKQHGGVDFLSRVEAAERRDSKTVESLTQPITAQPQPAITAQPQPAPARMANTRGAHTDATSADRRPPPSGAPPPRERRLVHRHHDETGGRAAQSASMAASAGTSHSSASHSGTPRMAHGAMGRVGHGAMGRAPGRLQHPPSATASAISSRLQHPPSARLPRCAAYEPCPSA